MNTRRGREGSITFKFKTMNDRTGCWHLGKLCPKMENRVNMGIQTKETHKMNELNEMVCFSIWNFERTDIVINKRPMGHIANLGNMRHNRISFMKSNIKYWDNEWKKKTLSSKFLQMFLCIVPFVTWWFHSFITYWVLSFYILKIFSLHIYM